MRLAPKLFALCWSFCLVKGAPPKEIGTSFSFRPFMRFTDEEDNFIIDELLRFPDESVRIFSKGLWEHMEEKHREKRRQNTDGFPCERTGDHLRERLSKTLMYNKPNTRVKVPEILFQKFPLLKKDRSKRVLQKRNRYTVEENQFILEELMKPSYTSLHAASTWATIKTKHDAKRREGCPGFENERAAQNLRKHMIVMKERGQLPKEVSTKLRINLEAGSSSRSTPPGETAEPQETNEYQDEDDEWIENLLQNPIDITPPDLG